MRTAKPRRSAGGAQLNRSLGELEGPISDPVLARLPKVAAFSSAESGSGEPPDRAQICPACDVDPVYSSFFSEPILGPLEWTFGRRNAKTSVKKSTTAWPCPASVRCLRWRPLVAAPPPFGLRRVLDGDCCAGGVSAARRRLRLILLCSRRYLEGQRIVRRA